MPDVTRKDLPEASAQEQKRADIGDDQQAEVEPSERGQNFAPRRGEDVRDNVPGRYAAQGRSKWGRGEPGEQEVRKAAQREIREAAARRSAGEREEHRGAEESVPYADTELEARSQRAQAGEESGAYVDQDSEESRRASHAGEFREGSSGSRARERMVGKGEKED